MLKVAIISQKGGAGKTGFVRKGRRMLPIMDKKVKLLSLTNCF